MWGETLSPRWPEGWETMISWTRKKRIDMLGLPDVEGDFETGLRQQVAGVGQPAPGGGINP